MARKRKREEPEGVRPEYVAAVGGALGVTLAPDPEVPPVPTPKARTAFVAAILVLVDRYLRRAELRRSTALRRRLESTGASTSDVERVAEDEVALGRIFAAKQKARIRARLEVIAALADPVERATQVRALMREERRIDRLRSDAMLARALAAAERETVRESSPDGAFWILGERENHCAVCLFMRGKFWPWEVLEEVRIPVHPNCACSLLSYGTAVSSGLLRPGDVPTKADAVALARGLVLDEVASVEATLDANPGLLGRLSEAFGAGGFAGWDPHAHPRDNLGKFVETLAGLVPKGQGKNWAAVLDPKTRVSRDPDGTFRLTSNNRIFRGFKSPADAAVVAFNRSAKGQWEGSVGGADPMLKGFDDVLSKQYGIDADKDAWVASKGAGIEGVASYEELEAESLRIQQEISLASAYGDKYVKRIVPELKKRRDSLVRKKKVAAKGGPAWAPPGSTYKEEGPGGAPLPEPGSDQALFSKGDVVTWFAPRPDGGGLITGVVTHDGPPGHIGVTVTKADAGGWAEVGAKLTPALVKLKAAPETGIPKEGAAAKASDWKKKLVQLGSGEELETKTAAGLAVVIRRSAVSSDYSVFIGGEFGGITKYDNVTAAANALVGAKADFAQLAPGPPDDDVDVPTADYFADLPAGSVRTYQTKSGNLIAWTKGATGYWTSDAGSTKFTSSALVNWIDDYGATLSSTTVGASGAPKGPDDFNPVATALDALPAGSVRKWKMANGDVVTATKQEGGFWDVEGGGVEGLYKADELGEWVSSTDAKILPGAGSTPGAPKAATGTAGEWKTKIEKLESGDAIKFPDPGGNLLRLRKHPLGGYELIAQGGNTQTFSTAEIAATAVAAAGGDIANVLVDDDFPVPEIGSVTKAAGLPSVKAADVKVHLEGMPPAGGYQDGYVLYRPDGSRIQFKRYYDGSYRAMESKKNTWGFSSGKVVKKKTTNTAALAKWAEKEGLLSQAPEAPAAAPPATPAPPAKMTGPELTVALGSMSGDSVYGFETAGAEPSVTVWKKASGDFSVKAVGGPPGSSTLYTDPLSLRTHLLTAGVTKSLGPVNKATGLPVGAPPAPVAGPPEPDADWGSLPTGTALESMLNATTAAVGEKMTTVEKSALGSYTSNGYGSINGQLREVRGLGDANVEGKIIAIDSIIEKAEPFTQDVVLWRGVGGKTAEAYKNAKVGNIIRDNAYGSTSTREDFAKSWGANLTLKIRWPKGAKAIWAKPVSSHASESEVLLPKGTALKVVAVRPYGANGTLLVAELSSGGK